MNLFVVEPDQKKSSTYQSVTNDYVSNGEYLKILVFNDRTVKSNFSSCISELENDYGSLFIFNYTSSFSKFFQVFFDLLIKNSPMTIVLNEVARI